MKNKIISLFILVFFLLIISPEFVSADDADQWCLPGDSTDFVSITGSELEQSFTPSMDKLSKVKLFLKGDGSGQVGLWLFHGDDQIATAEFQDEPTGEGTIAFFFNDITVTPGDATYTIKTHTNRENDYLLWKYKTKCYLGGKAIVDGASQNYDFGFTSYGYTATEGSSGETPGDTTPPPPDTNTNNNDATDQNEADGTNETASQTEQSGGDEAEMVYEIGAPILKVTSARADQVELSWAASFTEDINGYIIYRSQSETNGFVEIAREDANIMSHTDLSVEENQTYFYQVSAYRGTVESENSNTVEAVTGASDISGDEEDDSLSGLWVGVIVVIILILLFTGIFGYIYYQRKQNQKRLESDDYNKPKQI